MGGPDYPWEQPSEFDMFKSAVEVKVIDMGKGGATVRVEHPAMKGGAILGILEPGYPESALPEKIASCIETLHADYLTQLSQEDWDI